MYKRGDIIICIEEIKINGLNSLAKPGEVFTIDEIDKLSYVYNLKYKLRNNKTKWLTYFSYNTVIKYFESLAERRVRIIKEII